MLRSERDAPVFRGISFAKRLALFSCVSATMRKILRGDAKDKNGELILVGEMPIPFSKDKCPPATCREKRHLVRQGATIFEKETIR